MDISIRPPTHFVSDLEDDSDQDVAVEDVRAAPPDDSDDEVTVVSFGPAARPSTLRMALPLDDIVIPETEDETDDEVTVVSFGPAARPSTSRMALPLDDIVVPETEDETDDEVTFVGFRPAAGRDRSMEY
jgi:electron transfer flavoprotein alpha/beta subunit